MSDLQPIDSGMMTGVAGRYGGAGASVGWKIVLDLYYEDRIQEAFNEAVALGVGEAAYGTRMYRMVEAEYRSFGVSEVHDVTEILSVELPKELEESDKEFVLRAAREELESVFSSMGYEAIEKVRLSLLMPESQAMWNPYRSGYCVDKVPFDKVCLPVSMIGNEPAFRGALRHEYSHVVNLNLAQGHMPTWMEEAIAMIMEGNLSGQYLAALRTGAATWRNPRDLDALFAGDRRVATTQNGIWEAYQQSGMIGQYLVALKGKSGLGELGRAFSDNSVLQEIKMRLTGQTPADEALRETFGMGLDEVFDAAYQAAIA